MNLLDPRGLLGREPLQWGRDFCRGIMDFLSDPETSPAYRQACCFHLKKELVLCRSLLQRERVSPAGSPLVLLEGYPALRLLLVELLLCFAPREEKGEEVPAPGKTLAVFKKGLAFVSQLLMKMELLLEPGPSWKGTVNRCTAVLRYKGVEEKHWTLRQGTPLFVYSLPHYRDEAPASYLRDLHAILLFGRAGQDPGEGAGGKDTVFLHEMGHALFARRVRRQGLPGEEDWPFLLQNCLRMAAQRAKEGRRGEGLVSPQKQVGEEFCHIFARVMLADSLRTEAPPPVLPESSPPAPV